MSLERRWTHVGARRDIRGFFEHQLADRSAEGRVPRAIMGRYLSFLFYFDDEWVRAHMHAGARDRPPRGALRLGRRAVRAARTGRLASGGHDGKPLGCVIRFP